MNIWPNFTRNDIDKKDMLLFMEIKTSLPGCHNFFYFLSMQIWNKKFPVIMLYYFEDIMSNFFGLEGKLKLTGPFYSKS